MNKLYFPFAFGGDVFNRDKYRFLINPTQPIGEKDQKKGLSVQRVSGPKVWRCVALYHLTPEENQGKQVILIDALDESGNWVNASGLSVGWGWEGQRPDEQVDPKSFEKNPPEFRANVDLHMGQKSTVWINDSMGVPSDRAQNLSSSVEDLPKWNTLGHNSFIVLFQRMSGATDTPTNPNPPPVDPIPVDPNISAIKLQWGVIRQNYLTVMQATDRLGMSIQEMNNLLK
jgi:hypothetical protein